MFAYNGLSATSWNHAVSCLVREIMPKMALFRSVNYQFAQIGCFLVESPSLLIKSTLLNPTYSWFMGEAQGQRQLRFGDRVKNTHIFWAGDHGEVIFSMKMSTKHCNYRCFLHLVALKSRRTAHFCILFCNDARKTLAGTKKTKKHNIISQNIGRHQK